MVEGPSLFEIDEADPASISFSPGKMRIDAGGGSRQIALIGTQGIVGRFHGRRRTRLAFDISEFNVRPC